MIQVLFGENSFAIRRRLKQLTKEFSGDVERVDGETLELAHLPDILAGGTLFSQTRLVVVHNLSHNKPAWEVLPDWLGRLSEDVSLVLLESKLDKRTRTYKALKKAADMQEYPAWSDRDTATAQQWVREEAARHGITLDAKTARSLVERSGIDQWRLFHDIEKLSVFETITPELIVDVVEAHPSESVFALFEATLKGNQARLAEMLQTLKLSEEPYMIFGLLSGQVMQLAALSLSDGGVEKVATDFGAHPFALRKLAPYARTLSRRQIREIISAFEAADTRMKSSGVEPWLAVEQALAKVVEVK